MRFGGVKWNFNNWKLLFRISSFKDNETFPTIKGKLEQFHLRITFRQQNFKQNNELSKKFGTETKNHHFLSKSEEIHWISLALLLNNAVCQWFQKQGNLALHHNANTMPTWMSNPLKSLFLPNSNSVSFTKMPNGLLETTSPRTILPTFNTCEQTNKQNQTKMKENGEWERKRRVIKV